MFLSFLGLYSPAGHVTHGMRAAQRTAAVIRNIDFRSPRLLRLTREEHCALPTPLQGAWQL